MKRRTLLKAAVGALAVPFIVKESKGDIESHLDALKEKPPLYTIDLTKTTSIDYRKAATAVLLENQRFQDPQFIPLMRDAFKRISLWNMVSIQPLLGETGLVYYLNGRTSIDSDTVVANDFIEFQSSKWRDAEEGIWDYSEIERAVITWIRLNAGIKAEWDFVTSLGDTIREKCENLYREINKYDCNWILTSPEIAAIFETASAGFAPSPTLKDELRKTGVRYVGTINSRWRLYKDALYPVNQLLMGRMGDSYLDGGLVFTPRYMEQNGEFGPFGLRCGWKLVDPNRFVKMHIKNFIC